MSEKLLSIASYAKSFGLTPIKKLGQNFIYDKSLCDKIISGPDMIYEGQDILEIGPGPGGLTRSILEKNPRRLIVVEQDHRSIDLLNDLKKYYNNLEIIHGDALKLKISDLHLSNKVKIISNLPYNIGTKLLMNWSKEIELVKDITVMLQKEVVSRICAKVSTKDYGRLSIIMQILFTPIKQFDVSRDAFYPKPKVTSSVVRLIPKSTPINYEIIEKLEEITHIAFSARRKQIANSLYKYKVGIPKILEQLVISPNQRPEEISPELYLEIAKSL